MSGEVGPGAAAGGFGAPGRGFGPRAVQQVGGVAERGDVLAYLDRRIANAATIAANSAAGSETREIADDRRRQMEIMRAEIAQGLHEGAARIASDLANGAAR